MIRGALMKLNDFEQYVDDIIMERGRQYYQEKRTGIIENQQDHRYVVAVTGSDDYLVAVQLDEQETIVEVGCNCPYTGGPYCKHMVAALLALRKEEVHTVAAKKISSEKKTGTVLPVKTSLREQLKSSLSRQPKEKLINSLLDIAENDLTIADEIKAEFNSGSDEKEKWIGLMWRYIEEAKDDNGFISYRNCQRAVEGAYKVVARARRACDEQEYELAADLALCVMGEMTGMLQFADDSAGDVGTIIYEVQDVLVQITDTVPPGPKAEKCFLKILHEAGQRRYHDWSEWRIDLLHFCIAVITNPRQREQFEQYLKKISLKMEEKDQDAFSREYESEAIALLQYELIDKFDGKKAAVDFLYAHRNFSRFRELAIQEALAVQDYAKAEMLALEGEEHDHKLPGLIKKWKECRVEVYRLTKQLDKMREVSRELALSGEFTYYQKLKTMYDSAEWAQIYPGILVEFAKQSGYMDNKYTSAIIEEQEWEKLLEYVQKNPHRIVDFYRPLLANYPEQVYELFKEEILQDAARSSKRSHYKNVCSHLRLLVKIGGNRIAADLVKHLMFEYIRRPAFCEELKNVKVK